jgi:hypothetical protein
MRFVGIHGRAGSGKSTAATFLCRSLARFGWNPIRRSFADPIRAVAEALTGMSHVQFRDQEVKAGMSPFARPTGETLSNRCFLQLCGMMIRETFAAGVLRAVELRLPEHWTGSRDVVVFDDLRMPSERLWLKDRNARMILVLGRCESLTPDAAADVTEVQIPQSAFDAVVDNSGSHDALEAALDVYACKWFGACPEGAK